MRNLYLYQVIPGAREVLGGIVERGSAALTGQLVVLGCRVVHEGREGTGTAGRAVHLIISLVDLPENINGSA